MTPRRARPSFDLQSHSSWSDGALEPAEVVEAAVVAGVELLALTDHDDVDGIPQALDAAAAFGVRLIPAVEISTVDSVADDLHLLGYDLDYQQPALRAELARYRGDRATRSDRMVDALLELGLQVDDTELVARRKEGLPIGRPHIAEAVLAHPANAARLREEGIDRTATDVLVAYLIPGAPAYRTRTLPTVADAIELIHSAGGLAVWAHPFWDVDASALVEETLRRFAGYGLDGVEAFYIEHDEAQTLMLDDLATELGLLTTGSADFHGPKHPKFQKFRAFQLYGRTPNLGRLSPS